MTNEEFEKKWTENRKEILANNEEYRRIVQSYKSSGWIDYIIFIARLSLSARTNTKTIINSIVLQYFPCTYRHDIDMVRLSPYQRSI